MVKCLLGGELTVVLIEIASLMKHLKGPDGDESKALSESELAAAVKEATDDKLKKWLDDGVKVFRATLGPQMSLWIPMAYMVAEQSVGLKRIHYGIRKSVMHVSDISVAAYNQCVDIQTASGKDTKRMKAISTLLENKLKELKA